MHKHSTHLVLFSIVLLLFTSCFKEQMILPNHINNVFNFNLTADAENKILDSRGEQFYIDPIPEMYYGEAPYLLDKIKIRGQSVINFQRKSYAINLNQFIVLPVDGVNYREFEKFKLISMVYDYTYIENRFSHALLNEIELWPLFSFYTELKLNDHHQGLYLFIEDPEEYLFNYESAEIVIRRYYQNQISKYDLNTKIETKGVNYYTELFKSVDEIIVSNTGKQLYGKLSYLINLQNYMRKMALDFILKNGDYTDEIYFYAIQKDGHNFFDILPWDYDDIFSSNPHEVGRAWAVGKLFGERIYPNTEDVLQALNGRLIFSIEDDLDYIIAMDDYLYEMYLEELKFVLSRITISKIQNTFQSINEELLPFYNNSDIIEQSQFDSSPTSLELFLNNIKSKETFLIERIQWINNELETQ